MSYEDRIQAFWSAAESKGLKSNQRFLVLALLEIWRRKGFPVPCPISNAEIGLLTGWTAKTVWTVKKDCLSGFYWCKDGNGQRQPIYYFDEVDVPEELKEVKKVVKMKSEPPKPPKPEPRKKPKKVVAEAPDLWSKSRQSRADMRKTDKENEKLLAHKDKAFEPPSLDECIGLFLGKGSTKEEAQNFYDYFNSQGWYRSNGKTKIMNVDSAINYWINSKKNERSTDINAGSSHREERNRELQQELLARYGKI